MSSTAERWERYYEAARARRRVHGRDPLDRLIRQQAIREKVMVIGSSVFIGALIWGCYELLVR